MSASAALELLEPAKAGSGAACIAGCAPLLRYECCLRCSPGWLEVMLRMPLAGAGHARLLLAAAQPLPELLSQPAHREVHPGRPHRRAAPQTGPLACPLAHDPQSRLSCWSAAVLA